MVMKQCIRTVGKIMKESEEQMLRLHPFLWFIMFGLVPTITLIKVWQKIRSQVSPLGPKSFLAGCEFLHYHFRIYYTLEYLPRRCKSAAALYLTTYPILFSPTDIPRITTEAAVCAKLLIIPPGSTFRCRSCPVLYMCYG